MMKMSGRVTGCCIALLLFLTSTSATYEKLKSISNLKKVDFGRSVPKHSLLLLHWFANQVFMDNNNFIWLNFNPDNGDFGSHHYGNYEELLNPLPQGRTYYTLGNINQEAPIDLPPYVVNPRRGYEGRNMDRIIIRVQNGAGWRRIDQVFITQHYGNSQDTEYDADHTYQITPNLLRQIREFTVINNPQTLSDLIDRFGSNANEHTIRNTWGGLAFLGLLLYIVIEEKYSSNQNNRRPQNNNRPEHGSRRQENDFRVDMNDGPENNTLKYTQDTNCCGCCFRLIFLTFIVIIICYFYFGKT